MRLERQKKTEKEAEEKAEIEKITKEKPRQETEVNSEKRTEIENETEQKTENKSKGRKAKGIVLVSAAAFVLMVSLAVGYVFVARSYSSRFLPASQINGIDCGDMDAAEVSARLTPSVDDYVLEVKGRDFATGESGVVLGRITGTDVNMRYEGVLASVENVLAQQDEYKWIMTYFTDKPASYFVTMRMTYDEDKVKNFVQTWDAFQTENMRESQKAYISEYSEKLNGYQVIPGTISTKINETQAYQYIIDSLYDFKTELDLEALGCYEEAAEQNEERLNEIVNTANKWLSASVTYDWNGVTVVLDKEQLRDWITIAEGEPFLDAEQVRSFVKKQAKAYDTYGTMGSFTTFYNVEMDLYHASYGWKTDIDAETEELIKLIQEGSTASREPVYSVAARQKGTDDIGDSYVEVDLTHQHLYLHINGQIVLETDFVSGNMSTDSATPQGIFGITYKKADAVLRGEDYVSPVSYWMPFFGNYGMHDSAWRRAFGGDIYLTQGSHGCVNLPLDKAEVIFQYVSKGFPVICYYYMTGDPLASHEVQSVSLDSGEGQGTDKREEDDSDV